MAAYAVSGAAADLLGKAGNRGVGRGSALVIMIAGVLLTVTAAAVLLPESIRQLEKQNIENRIGSEAMEET